MGEVLLLQEHRGAGDLLRTSPDLPSDSGADSRAGGSIQEQESRCTPLLNCPVSKIMLPWSQLMFRFNGLSLVGKLRANLRDVPFCILL